MRHRSVIRRLIGSSTAAAAGPARAHARTRAPEVRLRRAVAGDATAELAGGQKSGTRSICPGKIRSGSVTVSRLASTTSPIRVS